MTDAAERDFVDELVRGLPQDWRFRDVHPPWHGDAFAVEAIREFLGEQKPELWGMIELQGESWMLVVIEGKAHLARFGGTDTQPQAEFRFLGSLAGGRYTETVRLDENEVILVDMRFEHPELPGGVLELKVDERGMRQRAPLRALLRTWGSARGDGS